MTKTGRESNTINGSDRMEDKKSCLVKIENRSSDDRIHGRMSKLSQDGFSGRFAMILEGVKLY